MPETLHRIGIVAALHKPQAVECTRRLVTALGAAGVEVLLEPRMEALELEASAARVATEWAASSQLVVAMGGDGTLLTAARAAAPAGVPLLGVDLGAFGFLAAEDFEQTLASLPQLLAGHFAIEERLMLQARLMGSSEARATLYALNDLVLSRVYALRMARVKVWVNGDFVTTYPADGLIAATPTGSTAYNLSAGGPLVDPQVACQVIIPICPHTLYARPLIVPAEAEICCVAEDTHPQENAEMHLVADGQVHAELRSGEEILITVAPFRTQLVRTRPTSFYSRLREKLNWGAER